MKQLIFAACLLVSVSAVAVAQPASMYLADISTVDTLDRSDTTITKQYKPAGVSLRMVWVTITSTVPDTLVTWLAPRYPVRVGGLVPDTTHHRVLAYQPELTSTIDTTGRVIFKPIIGSGVYQARFRVYEPLINRPFYFKSTYKKPGVWYIRIDTKE